MGLLDDLRALGSDTAADAAAAERALRTEVQESTLEAAAALDRARREAAELAGAPGRALASAQDAVGDVIDSAAASARRVSMTIAIVLGITLAVLAIIAIVWIWRSPDLLNAISRLVGTTAKAAA